MATIIHHGGRGDVDFNVVASRPVEGTAVEMKVCEDCAGNFFRAVPETAKQGEKFCARCRRKVVERMAQPTFGTTGTKGLAASRRVVPNVARPSL